MLRLLPSWPFSCRRPRDFPQELFHLVQALMQGFAEGTPGGVPDLGEQFALLAFEESSQQLPLIRPELRGCQGGCGHVRLLSNLPPINYSESIRKGRG